MKRIAKVKNFILKYKVFFMIGFGVLVALISAFIGTKGIIIQDIELPANIVYGSDFEMKKEAAGLFTSDITYEYLIEGSDKWTSEKPIMPGKYIVRAVSKNSFGANIYSKEVAFEIKAKDVRIEINDSMIEYGEYDNISYSTYDIVDGVVERNSKGLVGTDTISSISFKFDDLTKNTTDCSATDITVINSDGNDVTLLYNFSCNAKSIQFIKRQILVKPDQVTKLYDGYPIAYNNEISYETSSKIATGDSIQIETKIKDDHLNELSSNPTEAGSYTISVDTCKFFNSEGNDVSINYEVKYDVSYLVINRREITITTSSKTREYDGNYLFSYDYEKVEGKLLENHTVVYDPNALSTFSSIKDVRIVGDNIVGIKNEVSYIVLDENNIDRTNNYTIHYEYGTLMLTPYVFHISPLKQKDFVYNKELLTYSQALNNFDSEHELPENTNIKITVKYIDEDGNSLSGVINAGTYKIVIDNYFIEGDSSNNYQIVQNEVSFTIQKREIIIDARDQASKVYDGVEFLYQNNAYDVISKLDFVKDDSVLVSANFYLNDNLLEGNPINANDYLIKLKSFEYGNDTMKDNYIINIADDMHDFKIEQREITVMANTLDTVVYNKTVQNNYNYSVVSYDESTYTILDKDTFISNIDIKQILDEEVSIDSTINAGIYHLYVKNILFDDPINNSNYKINYSTKYTEYEILKRVIKVRANSLENKLYNGEIQDGFLSSDFVISDGEFIEGDNIEVSLKFYSLNEIQSASISPLNVGKYYTFIDSISYSNETMEGNYQIVNLNGENEGGIFEILKRPITIKATDLSSSIYSGINQSSYDETKFEYEDNSLMLVKDDSINVQVRFEIDGIKVTPKNAGAYEIFIDSYLFTNGSEDNYSVTISSIAAHFEINKKDLTITTIDDTIVYGNEFINKDVTYNGFVNNEDATVLEGTLIITSNYEKYDYVGEYIISCSGVSSNNYEIEFVDGKLLVTKATLNDISEDYNSVYDGKEHSIVLKFDGFVKDNSDYPEDKEESLGQINKYSFDSTSYSTDEELFKFKNVVSTTTIYYIVEFANYETITGSKTITITKKDLTISASNVTITYGDEFNYNGYGFTSEGFVEGESVVDLDGTLTFITNYVRFKDIDNDNKPYLKPTGCTSNNYNITYKEGFITLEKASLIDASSDYEGLYDGLAHSITIAVDGLFNNQKLEDVGIIYYSLSGEEGTYSLSEITQKDYNENPLRVYYKITFRNYKDVVGSRTIKINKAVVVVKANNNSIVYGDLPSDNGVTYSGLVNGETESVLDISSLSYTYNYNQFDNVGNYKITPNGVVSINDNYIFEYEDGVLTVCAKEVYVIWGDESLVYNGEYQSPECSISTLNGDVVEVNVTGKQINANKYSLDGGITYVVSTKYVAVAASLNSDNYVIISDVDNKDTIEFYILRKDLSITPSNATITYGQIYDSTNIQFTYEGFVGSDDASVLKGILDISCDYHQFDPVTDVSKGIRYFIYCSGLSADNYNVYFKSVELVVEKAELVDTSTSYVGTYDGQDHFISLGASGFLNNKTWDDEFVFAEYSIDQISYDIDSSIFAQVNYTENEVIIYYSINFINYKTINGSKSIKINQKELTVTTNDSSIIYGEIASGNGVTVEGLVNEETVDYALNNLINLGYTSNYNQFDNIGNYEIIANGLTSKYNNYSITYVKGILTVTPKEITATWGDDNLVYNGKDQVISATAVGLVNNDSCDITVSGAKKDVGEGYIAEIIGLSNSNYYIDILNKKHTFNIVKASLIISANDKTITYGDSGENDGVKYEGFQGDDDESSLSGSISYVYTHDDKTTLYVPGDDCGNYLINISGLSSDNYTISFISGTLIVEQLEASLTWDNLSYVYDGLEHCATATVNNLFGDDVCSVIVSGGMINAGTYTATATSLTNSNYKLPESAKENYIIRKAKLTDTTIGFDETYNGGEFNITLGLTGFVNGETFETANGIAHASMNNLTWTDYNKLGSALKYTNVINTTNNPIAYYYFEFDNYEVIYIQLSQAHKVIGSGINSGKPVGSVLVNIRRAEVSFDDNDNIKYEAAYDGDEHGVSVKVVGFVNSETLNDLINYATTESYAKITYCLSENGAYVPSNYLYKNFTDGEITVYFKVVFGNYETLQGSSTVNILKRELVNGTEGYDDVYNGYEHGISVTATGFVKSETFKNTATVKYSLTSEGPFDLTETPKVTNYTETPLVVYYQITFKNYADINGYATINIRQRDLYVHSMDETITYGEVPHDSTISFGGLDGDNKTGFIVGENENTVLDYSNVSFVFDYEQFDDVGEYAFRAKGVICNEYKNYNIIYVDATLFVVEKEISISWSNLEFTYDGNEHYPIATPSGYVNNDSFALSVSMVDTSIKPIRASEYNYICKASFAEEVKNYKLPTDVTTEFKINKVTIYVTPLDYNDNDIGGAKIYDTKQFLYDIVNDNYEITIEERAKIGHNGNDKIALTLSFDLNDGSKYDNPINAGTYNTSIKSYVVSHIEDEIEVDYTDCYDIRQTDISRELIIVKLTVTIDSNSIDPITYDGLNHYYSSSNRNYTIISPVDEELLANINYELDFTIFVKFTKSSYSQDTYKNAGTYKISIDSDTCSSNNLNIVYKTGSTSTAIIEPKKIDVSLEDFNDIIYSKQAFVYPKISLINGDYITLNVTYDQTLPAIHAQDNVTPINAGTYDINCDSTSTWYSLTLTNDSIIDNYTFELMLSEGETVATSTLVINKREVFITLDDCEFVYDGDSHKYEGSTKYYGASFGNPDGQLIDAEIKTLKVLYDMASSEPVHAGTYKLSILKNESTIRFDDSYEESMQDLTNYIIQNQEEYFGSLVIKPRDIYLYPETIQDKIYDGTPCDSYNTSSYFNFIYDREVSTNEFVKDEKLKINVKFYLNGEEIDASEVIDAGTYTYSGYVLSSNYQDRDYNIHFEEKTLTISKRTVYITANDLESIVFDNLPHSYSDVYEGDDFSYAGVSISDPSKQIVSGQTLIMSVYLDGESSQTNAGTYNLVIDTTSCIIILDDEDKTEISADKNYVILIGQEKVFKILKRDLTIGPLDRTKTYNGQEFDYGEFDFNTTFDQFNIVNVADNDNSAITSIKFIYEKNGEAITPLHTGEYTIKLDKDNTIVSDNYNLIAGENKKLVIEKRKIVISLSNDVSMIYCNSPFVDTSLIEVDSTLKGNSTIGFVSNDKEQFVISKYIYSLLDEDGLVIVESDIEPINVGKYEISIEYYFLDATIENDYDIVDINNGLLTITKRDVTIVPVIEENEYKVYDGEAYIYKIEDNNYALVEGENMLPICEGHTLKIFVEFYDAISIDYEDNEFNLSDLNGIDVYQDEVTEAATYSVRAYKYLINDEENDNYSFHSESTTYVISRRGITLSNGDHSFEYNGRDETISQRTDDLSLVLDETIVDDPLTLSLLLRLNYTCYLASDSHETKYKDVLIDPETNEIISYKNTNKLFLFVGEENRTYNFDITVKQGKVTIIPKDVDFIIDVDEEDATKIFDACVFDFVEENFYIETLCESQILTEVNWEDIASLIIKVGSYNETNLDLSLVTFKLKDVEDNYVPLTNYNFNRRFERDITINKAYLSFYIDDSAATYTGEKITIEDYFIIKYNEGSFEFIESLYLSNYAYEVEEGTADLFYRFDPSDAPDKVNKVLDAGTYKVTIQNYNFLFYGEKNSENFDFDYSGKTEFEFKVNQYDFAGGLQVSTDSCISIEDKNYVAFIYGENQKAYSKDFTAEILDTTFNAFGLGYSIILIDDYSTMEYMVTKPREEALKNELPLIIIDVQGNNVTKNFTCSKWNDEHQCYVIDYECETIEAKVGLINIDSELTMEYDTEKIYDGKDYKFDGNNVSGKLYNNDSKDANLYFKAEIITTYYKNVVTRELGPDEGICAVGQYIIIVGKPEAYLNEACTRRLSDEYYVSYSQMLTEEDEYYSQTQDRCVIIMNIVPRSIYLKPLDLLNQSFNGEPIGISSDQVVYVYKSASQKDYMLIEGHYIDAVGTSTIGINEIAQGYSKENRNLIDIENTKIYDAQGNDVTYCYKLINEGFTDKDDKGNEIKVTNSTFYGKISIQKRYIVIEPSGASKEYDGEALYNNNFSVISDYAFARECNQEDAQYYTTADNYGLLTKFGHTIQAESESCIIIAVGRKYNKVYCIFKDSEGRDVTSLYKVIYRQTETAYLTITQREITLKSGDRTEVYYEGMPPVMEKTYEIISGSLVPGDYIVESKINWTAYLLTQDVIPNTFSIDTNRANKAILDQYGAVVAQNYKITYSYGTLRVV